MELLPNQQLPDNCIMHKGEVLAGVTHEISKKYIKYLDELDMLQRIIDNPLPGLGVSKANVDKLRLVMSILVNLEKKYPTLKQIRLNP